MTPLAASAARGVPRFGRGLFVQGDVASRIGGGGLGGKAQGLVRIRDDLASRFAARPLDGVAFSIPRMAVIATDAFDAFMKAGGLYDIALSDAPDDRIAHAFQRADLPADLVGDLRALVEETRTPLAVRSSSLLEDALAHPFAGVYDTKMVPNHQPEPATRFRGLVEAVKLVYASTFFESARTYRRAVGADDRDEKMAVIVQEVVGARHGRRFYPHVSAVGRSFNYYPTGNARPEDGLAQLALGLGKTIVDGGICWSYSPRFPSAPPPFASARDMLEATQTRFWAVNVGDPPPYDPIAETEYLVHAHLADADYDGTLRYLASTYVASSDRLSPGVGREGPRVLDFAPLLKLREWPLNDAILELLALAEASTGSPVEIELAATPPDAEGSGRVGLLQVRMAATPGPQTAVADEDLSGPDVLLASGNAMGNGVVEGIRDIVYTKPEAFELRHTRAMAREVAAINRALVEEGRAYLLIGFGRWGSSDDWLGIPVTWGQVAGARAVVEAQLPGRGIEPSQGSHFFHNMSSLGVVFFAVAESDPVGVRWDWLAGRPAVTETDFLRHLRLDRPLEIRVDGRRGRGFVRGGRPEGGAP